MYTEFFYIIVNISMLTCGRLKTVIKAAIVKWIPEMIFLKLCMAFLQFSWISQISNRAINGTWSQWS